MIDIEQIGLISDEQRTKTDSFARVEKIIDTTLARIVNNVPKSHLLSALASIVRKSVNEEIYLIESDATIATQ